MAEEEKLEEKEIKEENPETPKTSKEDKKSKNIEKDLNPSKKGDSSFDPNEKYVDLKTQKKRDKQKVKLREDWADEVVASKKIKREETRRKLKKAMLFVLTFSVIITSVVYVMLLFIQENNVRITAKYDSDEKQISLSMDNEYWTPYLNSKGPDTVIDLSYSTEYEREYIRSIDEVKELLSADEIQVGDMHGEQYICFTFMLRNSGSLTAMVDYQMYVETDGKGLENAVRVMWGECYKSKLGTVDESTGVAYEPTVETFATLSNNQLLANTSINAGRTEEDGYIEYLAYPLTSTKFDNVYDYEQDLQVTEQTQTSEEKIAESKECGFFATTPFYSDEYVFQKSTELAAKDIMYVYVCIWLEGSDFDCTDDKLASTCKIGVDFVAY